MVRPPAYVLALQWRQTAGGTTAAAPTEGLHPMKASNAAAQDLLHVAFGKDGITRGAAKLEFRRRAPQHAPAGRPGHYAEHVRDDNQARIRLCLLRRMERYIVMIGRIEAARQLFHEPALLLWRRILAFCT